MTLLESIRNKSVKVGIIGLGYVGLPLAITTAQNDFHVLGFDVDEHKIEKIGRAKSYIDAVSDEAMRGVCESGQFSATSDFTRLCECRVIVICVPTPLSQQREPNLSYVEETATRIAENATKDTLVSLESTTWPGTTEEILHPIFVAHGFEPGKDLFLGFSPEREDPGNRSFNTKSIPKIVAGSGDLARALMEAFYSQVVDSVVTVSTTQIAEAVKITENIFRAVNIALVNELKLIYDAMGIDIWEVIDGAATKPFGYMPFYPGPGLGGHCIPIDPFYLTWKARQYEVPTRFIELAGEINTAMPRHVIDRLREVIDLEHGRGLRGARILLVGLAYKKNVSDMRESPSMKLMQLLEEAGAEVDFIDPHVAEIPPMREYRVYESRKATDPATLKTGDYLAVLIATDHDQIDYNALMQLGCPVVDTRNAIARRGLSGKHVTKV